MDCGDRPDLGPDLPFAVVDEVTDDERFTGGWLAGATSADLRTAVGEYGLTLADG